MDIWTQEDVENTIKLIGNKASIDSNFRKSILNSPNKVIKEVTGKEIPDGFVIKIIENDSGIDQTFVLPDFQSDELNDDELDAVAGGGAKNCDDQCNTRCASYCSEKL